MTNELEATGDLRSPTEAPSGPAPDAATPLAPPGYELLEEIGSDGLCLYPARDALFTWVNGR